MMYVFMWCVRVRVFMYSFSLTCRTRAFRIVFILEYYSYPKELNYIWCVDGYCWYHISRVRWYALIWYAGKTLKTKILLLKSLFAILSLCSCVLNMCSPTTTKDSQMLRIIEQSQYMYISYIYASNNNKKNMNEKSHLSSFQILRKTPKINSINHEYFLINLLFVLTLPLGLLYVPPSKQHTIYHSHIRIHLFGPMVYLTDAMLFICWDLMVLTGIVRWW